MAGGPVPVWESDRFAGGYGYVWSVETKELATDICRVCEQVVCLQREFRKVCYSKDLADSVSPDLPPSKLQIVKERGAWVRTTIVRSMYSLKTTRFVTGSRERKLSSCQDLRRCGQFASRKRQPKDPALAKRRLGWGTRHIPRHPANRDGSAQHAG